MKKDPDANIGPKRNENGEWRRFHSEKLHSLYHSPNVVRMIESRWTRHLARIINGRSAFKILAYEPIGRPRYRLEEKIRMNLKEMGVNTRNWIDSAQDWDCWESPCECDIEPPGSIIHGVR